MLMRKNLGSTGVNYLTKVLKLSLTNLQMSDEWKVGRVKSSNQGLVVVVVAAELCRFDNPWPRPDGCGNGHCYRPIALLSLTT